MNMKTSWKTASVVTLGLALAACGGAASGQGSGYGFALFESVRGTDPRGQTVTGAPLQGGPPGAVSIATHC